MTQVQKNPTPKKKVRFEEIIQKFEKGVRMETGAVLD